MRWPSQRIRHFAVAPATYSVLTGGFGEQGCRNANGVDVPWG